MKYLKDRTVRTAGITLLSALNTWDKDEKGWLKVLHRSVFAISAGCFITAVILVHEEDKKKNEQ